MNRIIILIVLLITICAARATGPLSVKVIVMLKDHPDQAAAPFPDVGGFTIKRSMSDFKDASCPDSSNRKGELVCKIKCDSPESDMRLHMFSPTREHARILTGLTQPSAVALDIVGCKVTSKQPIQVVYQTAWALLGEARTKAPDVVAAVLLGEGWQSIKPFERSSAQLQALASKQENRRAILEIGWIAGLQLEAMQHSPVKWQFPGNANYIADYVVGTRSIALQAAFVDASDGKNADMVKISPEWLDFYSSIDSVQKELNRKSVLNEKEIELADDLRQFKKNSTLKGESGWRAASQGPSFKRTY